MRKIKKKEFQEYRNNEVILFHKQGQGVGQIQILDFYIIVICVNLIKYKIMIYYCYSRYDFC